MGISLDRANVSAIVAATLGGLTFTLTLVSIPILFAAIGHLESDLEMEMNDYRLMTDEMWSEVMEQRKPLIERIRRQTTDKQQKEGRRFSNSPLCTDGSKPASKGGAILTCESGNSCPTGTFCTIPINIAQLDSEYFICCSPPDPTRSSTAKITPMRAQPKFANAQNNKLRESVKESQRATFDSFFASARKKDDGDFCVHCEIPTCDPGPPGPPGPVGIDGPDGEDGFDGRDGKGGRDVELDSSGCPTSPCDPGRPGPPGQNGPKGRIGAAGPAGREGGSGGGSRGRPGPGGPTGDSGPSGRPGSGGRKGPSGRNGQSGGRGPPGTKGPRGSGGSRGPGGRPGSSGPRGGRTGGRVGPTGGAGPTGSRGSDGPVGPSGSGGAPGNDGQYCSCPERTVTDGNARPLPRFQG